MTAPLRTAEIIPFPRLPVSQQSEPEHSVRRDLTSDLTDLRRGTSDLAASVEQMDRGITELGGYGDHLHDLAARSAECSAVLTHLAERLQALRDRVNLREFQEH